MDTTLVMAPVDTKPARLSVDVLLRVKRIPGMDPDAPPNRTPGPEVINANGDVEDRFDEANTELQHQVDTLKRELIDSTYYNRSGLQVPHGVWVFALDVLHALNRAHSNFRSVFFDDFRALLGENDDAVFVRQMGNYIRLVQSMYMFVRVERPVGSLRFVLAYVKCERVFSLLPRFEQMRLRLNRVPPRVLKDMEEEENKALRLACVGETNYERAIARHSDTSKFDVLLTPLGAAIYAKDEDAVEVLLDGGADPNEVDGNGRNALHMAADKGCRLPLFNRILGIIHNVNALGWNNEDWETALMRAVACNHLDMVVSLMNHPEIDLNAQGFHDFTALHRAVEADSPAILAQLLSDDRVDTSLKASDNDTPLKFAIVEGYHECVKILRKHGAPEPSSSEEEEDDY